MIDSPIASVIAAKMYQFGKFMEVHMRRNTPHDGSGAANPVVGRGAIRLLLRLSAGEAAQATDDGVFLGGEDVTAEVAALIAHDLAARDRRGGVRLTAPGAVYAKRMAARSALRRAGRQGDTAALAVIAPFRDQHQDIDIVVTASGDKVAERRFINHRECPLAWLRRRRDRAGRPLIDDRQFEAGMHLRNDFERGGLSPRVTASWSALPVGRAGAASRRGGLDPSDSQMGARLRFRRAVTALGPGLAEVAIRTCCAYEGLEAVEKSLDWPARSGKVVLSLALSRLADYYGIGKK